MPVDLVRGTGSRGHQPALLVQAERDPVIQQAAVLEQHEAEPALARLELPPTVGVHQLQQILHVRTEQFELAERRAVVNAGARPHRLGRAPDGILIAFARTRVPERPAVVGPGFVHPGTLADVPRRQRRSPDGDDQFTGIHSADGAEADRRHRGAERGGAHIPGGASELRRHVADDMRVAGLALVGCHAGGGIALDVLHRGVVFPQRQVDIRRGDVILEVNEGLGAGGTVRHGPVRLDIQCGFTVGAEGRHRWCVPAQRRYRLVRGIQALLQAGRQGKRPRRGADRAL